MDNGSFFVVGIFILTYVGVAFGRVPGLTIDRTGIALLGAIVMITSGAVSVVKAVEAVDLPTILLLYALMVLSAQLRLGGFYTWVSLRITSLLKRPRIFLLVMMLTSAVLSAVLANDIICLAFTPVLTISLMNAGLNPVPFLIALAVSSNIGSAATIIGNPQNMLIGQVGKLNFGDFLAWCGPPSVVALIASYGLICRLFRHGFRKDNPGRFYKGSHSWPQVNRWQVFKGIAATVILMVLFFTPIPRELSAIAVAGVLLCSRHMKSRQMLELIDWHLITLFCALFVIIQGIVAADIPAIISDTLAKKGIVLQDLSILTLVSTLLSNLVSNVPATMLLTRFLDPADPLQWYTLAVSSTFAGNLILIGSIANLIVIEQARNFGVEISFKTHLRIGFPVTLVSLAILVGWIYL